MTGLMECWSGGVLDRHGFQVKCHEPGVQPLIYWKIFSKKVLQNPLQSATSQKNAPGNRAEPIVME
jgi:hypothetical protein